MGDLGQSVDTMNLPQSHIRYLKKNRVVPTCPRCGSTPVVERSHWGVKHKCCGLWGYNYKPLVDHNTHVARINAHSAFDAIWKSGRMTRSEAYVWLADQLGVEEDYAHMSGMSRERAELVEEICVEFLAADDSAPVQEERG